MAAAVFDQGVRVGPHLDQRIDHLKWREGIRDLVGCGHWMESKWMSCPPCPPLFPQTVREKRGDQEGRFRQKGRDTPSAPRNRTSASSGGVGVALSGKKALTRSLPIRRRDFTQPTSSASSVIRLALWPVCRSAPISRKR